MEDLELLKKKWNEERPNEFRRYREEELLVMTQKKSVSVAKWVFMIGILEILLWGGYQYLYNLQYLIFRVILFVSFILITIFIFFRIKNNDNAKSLMENILTLRRTIITYLILSCGAMVYESIVDFNLHANNFIQGWNDGYTKDCGCENAPLEMNTTTKIIFGFANLIFFLIVGFVYNLLYGKSLKKLNENYNELKTLS